MSGKSLALHDSKVEYEMVNVQVDAKMANRRRRALVDMLPCGLDRFARTVIRREFWIREWAAVITSVAVLGVMAGILRLFDGQPFAFWTAPFTLNAFLSAAVSLLYLLLMSSVSSCILQLRWVHFRARNPLADFQAFDSVNHGPLQSFAMLLTPLTSLVTRERPARFLTSRDGLLINFAALLVIVVAAIGPLAQLLLDQTTVDFLASHSATLPIATSMTNDPSSQIADTDFSKMAAWNDPTGTNINGAIYSGAFLSQPITAGVPTTCSTGNCTWGNYSSFLVKSQVKNATDSIILADIATIRDAAANPKKDLGWPFKPLAKLPGPLYSEVPVVAFLQQYILNYDINSTLTTVGDNLDWNITLFWMAPSPLHVQTFDEINDNSSTNIRDYLWPFNSTTFGVQLFYVEMSMQGTVADSDALTNVSFSYGRTAAWDCTFEIVLQQLKATQTNGFFSEQAVGDPIGVNGTICNGTYTSDMDCTANLTSQGQHYPISLGAAHGLANRMASFFTGYVYLKNGRRGDSHGTRGVFENTESSSNTASFAYWLASNELFGNSTGTASNPSNSHFAVDGMMSNIAQALSNWLRTSNATVAQGDVHKQTVVYVVNWGWISVPTAFVVATFLLLLFTVIETRRLDIPVWTDSILAALIHGPDEETRRDLSGLYGAERLEGASHDVYVRLRGRGLVRDAGY